MAYRLQDRHKQDQGFSTGIAGINLRIIGALLFLFTVISMSTSWVYSSNDTTKITKGVSISNSQSHVIGPLVNTKENQVYEVALTSRLRANSWLYMSGDVLDANKKFLFAFGKTLEHYPDEDYSSSTESYTMDFTLKNKGTYYIKLKTQGSTSLNNKAYVKVTTKKGSGIPHFWLGFFTLTGCVVCFVFGFKTEIEGYMHVQSLSNAELGVICLASIFAISIALYITYLALGVVSFFFGLFF